MICADISFVLESMGLIVGVLVAHIEPDVPSVDGEDFWVSLLRSAVC